MDLPARLDFQCAAAIVVADGEIAAIVPLRARAGNRRRAGGTGTPPQVGEGRNVDLPTRPNVQRTAATVSADEESVVIVPRRVCACNRCRAGGTGKVAQGGRLGIADQPTRLDVQHAIADVETAAIGPC